MELDFFTKKPTEIKNCNGKTIYIFDKGSKNLIIEDFGKEWTSFHDFDENELQKIGDEYFDIFDKENWKDKVAIDFGGGTGRWTKYIAPYFKKVYLIEPSDAIYHATKVLHQEENIVFIKSTIEECPLPSNSFEFAMSLGVLHHIENTEYALQKIKEKIKPNGTFYFYLYHNLESYGILKKIIFSFVDFLRKVISKLPFKIKKCICNVIGLIIYFPLARISKITKLNLPLSYYSNKSLYIMQNDALDRFGTKLEKRYSKKTLYTLLEETKFADIEFSIGTPFYHGKCQTEKF